MIVCPYCGPENVMYSGRVVLMVCGVCRAFLKAATSDTKQLHD